MRILSEGPKKITQATIEDGWRRRRPDQRLHIRDLECRGLSLVIHPTTMSWVFSYRPRGVDPLTGRRWPNRTVTLGTPESRSHDAARTEVNRLKGHIKAGADPVADKKADVEATRRKQSATLGRLAEEYERSLPRRMKMRGAGKPSPTYVANELAQVRLALAAMKAADMAAADLSESHVRRFLTSSDHDANLRARFGGLTRFLDWAQDAGHISVNPCSLIGRARRPRAPRARSHYLKPVALAQLWRAADRLRHPVWRDFAHFLIAIPCRRGEAAQLEWSELDLDAAEWRQPGRKTKNGEPHRLHLHPLAIDVLRARREATRGAGLVFPAPQSGEAINTFTDLKEALTLATEEEGRRVDGWTWHDFRRSFASALGEAGVSETIADSVLNHAQSATRGGVLGVYQRSARWPEQVSAMNHWGRLLAGAIAGTPVDAQVVPLRATG